MSPKKLAVTLALLFLSSALLHAAPCAIGSLSSYYSLAGGCTIGTVTFSDFRAFTTPNGSTLINSDNVTVNPISTPGNPGFQFDIGASAMTGEFFDIAFGFQVTGNFIGGLSASMLNSSFTDDGVNTVIEDYCMGGQFGADQTQCSGALNTLLLIDSEFFSSLSDGTTFAPAMTLGVVKDIGIDGALAGTASLRSVTNQFLVTGGSTTPAPIPGSMYLFASGIAILVAGRFRKRKA